MTKLSGAISPTYVSAWLSKAVICRRDRLYCAIREAREAFLVLTSPSLRHRPQPLFAAETVIIVPFVKRFSTNKSV